MNAWVGFIVSDCWLPIANVVKAMKKWPGSGEPNETGVNLAYGTEDKWFDILQKDQQLAKRYSMAMEAHGGGEGFLVKWTVEGYPWGSLGEATVVDVCFLLCYIFHTSLNFDIDGWIPRLRLLCHRRGLPFSDIHRPRHSWNAHNVHHRHCS